KERPAKPEIPRGPLLQPIVPPANYKSPLVEKCLAWLVNRWPANTVRTRDFMRFGPPAARNRKSAIAMAEILTENGWLVEVPKHRHDVREWQIVRGPSNQRTTWNPFEF